MPKYCVSGWTSVRVSVVVSAKDEEGALEAASDDDLSLEIEIDTNTLEYNDIDWDRAELEVEDR